MNTKKAEDIKIVGTLEVDCDGDSGSVKGHPRVYLNMENKDKVVCPYCGRTFIYDASKKEAAHH
jgi:uncharacterized Zn-finger protein